MAEFKEMIEHNKNQTELQICSAQIVDMIMVQKDPSYSTMTKLIKLVMGCSGKHFLMNIEALRLRSP